MGNEIAIPNVRRSVHFRIENYEGIEGYKSLSATNQDILVMKRRMSDMGFEPADMWKDATWFESSFYDKG